MKRFISLALASMTVCFILMFCLCAFYLAGKNTVSVQMGSQENSGLLAQVGLSSDKRPGGDDGNLVKHVDLIGAATREKIAAYKKKFYYFIPAPLRLAEKLLYAFSQAAGAPHASARQRKFFS
ncbi:MAG: hypothetical protein LBC56_04995 [Oscillospiraceae bacterium]|jgi:hypothetical protein|nr:hypothetical protein [Oscillospiraceae bacterium]